jgi:hypothetical protein
MASSPSVGERARQVVGSPRRFFRSLGDSTRVAGDEGIEARVDRDGTWQAASGTPLAAYTA